MRICSLLAVMFLWGSASAASANALGPLTVCEEAGLAHRWHTGESSGCWRQLEARLKGPTAKSVGRLMALQDGCRSVGRAASSSTKCAHDERLRLVLELARAAGQEISQRVTLAPLAREAAQLPGAQSPGAQSPGAQSPGAQSPGAQSPSALSAKQRAEVDRLYASTLQLAQKSPRGLAFAARHFADEGRALQALFLATQCLRQGFHDACARTYRDAAAEGTRPRCKAPPTLALRKAPGPVTVATPAGDLRKYPVVAGPKGIEAVLRDPGDVRVYEIAFRAGVLGRLPRLKAKETLVVTLGNAPIGSGGFTSRSDRLAFRHLGHQEADGTHRPEYDGAGSICGTGLTTPKLPATLRLSTAALLPPNLSRAHQLRNEAKALAKKDGEKNRARIKELTREIERLRAQPVPPVWEQVDAAPTP